MGVMKVWLRRVKISWISSSPRCSRTLISVAARPAGQLPTRTPSTSKRAASEIISDLFQKQSVELLVTGKKSHKL